MGFSLFLLVLSSNITCPTTGSGLIAGSSLLQSSVYILWFLPVAYPCIHALPAGCGVQVSGAGCI